MAQSARSYKLHALKYMSRLEKYGELGKIVIPTRPCGICWAGRMKAKKVKPEELQARATRPLKLIYIDIVVPFRVKSIERQGQYYLLATYYYSTYRWLEILSK